MPAIVEIYTLNKMLITVILSQNYKSRKRETKGNKFNNVPVVIIQNVPRVLTI